LLPDRIGSIRVHCKIDIALHQRKDEVMALDMVEHPRRSAMDELHGYYIEDLAPGMTALYARTVTDADIVLFAGISGDVNPVHLNHEFAANTVFEGRIAHGLLTASFISTVLGTKLPGPGCVYLSQNLKFKAPVRSGDTVSARATILEVPGKAPCNPRHRVHRLQRGGARRRGAGDRPLARRRLSP